MATIKGDKLTIYNLYPGRRVVLSNTVIHCGNCGHENAIIGDTVADIVDIVGDVITVDFLVPIRCRACNIACFRITYSVPTTVDDTTAKEAYEKVLRQSGALN